MQYKHQYRTENQKDEWQTPDYIFNPLNEIFQFTVDGAATSRNSLCPVHFSDGLKDSWQGHRVFCNPPYSSGQYGNWIQKAIGEYLLGNSESVLLLPASWETKAFDDAWENASYFIFPHKRIKFELFGESQGGAPFSSLIVVFMHAFLSHGEIQTLHKIGRIVDLYSGYRAPRYIEDYTTRYVMGA